MSDTTLRQAERVGDTVAILRHRIRAGELDEHRVALAAYLGDPTALAVAEPAALELHDDGPEHSLVYRALRWGGLDRRTLAVLSTDFVSRLPQCTESAAAIAATRAWIACPCEEHQRAAAAAGDVASDAAQAARYEAGYAEQAWIDAGDAPEEIPSLERVSETSRMLEEVAQAAAWTARITGPPAFATVLTPEEEALPIPVGAWAAFAVQDVTTAAMRPMNLPGAQERLAAEERWQAEHMARVLCWGPS